MSDDLSDEEFEELLRDYAQRPNPMWSPFVCRLLSEHVALRSRMNTPELHDFAKAVALEASHQRERWGSAHDEGKAPADWFWVIGYLAGKALASHLKATIQDDLPHVLGATNIDRDKALHHTITAAAALANWHAAINGDHTGMRPGIERPKDGT